MRIRSRGFSILFKLALVVFGCTGLQMSLHLFTPQATFAPMKYFTNLSNALAVVYFLLAALRQLIFPDSSPTFLPWLRGIVTMALTVTMVVAHLMLSPADSLTLVLLHYVTPIMALLDWLLLDEKGLMHRFSPLVWAVFPLLYVGFVFVAVQLGFSMGSGGRLYPYGFLNVDALGVATVLKTLGILLVGFVALGYVYVFIDFLMSTFEIKKRSSRR